MGFRGKVALGIGIAVLLVQGVQADTSGVSETIIQPSFWDRVADKAVLNYFGIFRGGALTDLGNSQQPTIQGTPDPDYAQSFENLVTAGYKFNPTTSAGVMLHFMYTPVGNQRGVQMLDPILYFGKTGIYNKDGLRINARVTAGVAMTSNDLSLSKDAAYVSPTLIVNYDVPKTSLTLGVFTYIRGYIPNGGPNPLSYKIYVAPNANYQISQTVAATLWVDLVQATRRANTGFISGIDNYTVDIEPGISWDITKNFTLNPYINIYPGYFTLASTSIQANLIAKVF